MRDFLLDRWRRSGLGARLALASVAAAASAIAAVSCSLIVEHRSVQCQSDADCAQFPSAACDLKTGACVQAQCAMDNCVCNPETSADILNGCPQGTCDPFSNARVTKLVGGKVPAVPDAGTGGSPSPTFSCGGPDGGGTGGGEVDAGAPPTCEDLPNPIFLYGPTSIQPLLTWVAQIYAGMSPAATVVYQDQSSCTAVQQMYNEGFMDNAAGNAAYTSYFDASGNAHTCQIVSPSVRLDIAISDVFPQTCGFDLNDDATNVVDTPGPVQAMGFVVPKGSQQKAISAEAAYMVFGFGSASGVSPWTNVDYIFQRDDSSGTQNMVAAALGLPADAFRGTVAPSSPALAALVGCSPEPESTIGVLAVDLAQSGASLDVLAYQHFGQSCGYLPDSTPSGSTTPTNDKYNVRNGHYFIWGPVHLMTAVDHHNDNASLLINYVSGISPPPADQPVDIFGIWAGAHLVPQCAMRVTRSSDGGPISAVSPTVSCYCRYDEATLGSTTCTKCQTASDCSTASTSAGSGTSSGGALTCSPFGYCEPTP